MPKLIIPTRNRPVSASRVLRYLAHFYPGAEVIVADGSDPRYAAGYDEAIATCQARLALDYRRYPPHLPLAERIGDVLASLEDELVIVGADDDFPVLDVLAGAAPFLTNNPAYVLAIGAVVSLALESENTVRARLMHARTIEHRSPVKRVIDYARWPFPTSFALVRRQQLMRRCQRLDLNAAPFFGDFTMGLHDCLAGKLLALPDIGYFRTENEAHSKLRPRGDLYYLEHAADVLALKEHYRETLAALPGLRPERAEALAVKLVGRRIGTRSSPPHNEPGFGQSELFNDPVVRRQHHLFRRLFAASGRPRERYLPRLRWVVDSMLEVANSASDNIGEARTYDTLEQIHGAAPPASNRPTDTRQ